MLPKDVSAYIARATIDCNPTYIYTLWGRPTERTIKLVAYDLTLYQAGLFLVVHRALGPLALGPLERSLARQVPDVHVGQPLVAIANIGSLFW